MKPEIKARAKAFWGIGLAFLLLAGALGAAFVLPFGQLKPFFDLFSRRGHLDSFTPASYARLASFLPFLGFTLLALALLAVVFRAATLRWTQRLLDYAGFQLKSTGNDFREVLRLARARRPAWVTLAAVLGLTLAALAFRWVFINKPFGYDEAYTFEAFAVRPFFYVVTDYSLPNNHIFHTILVRISYLLFGMAPWSVRLAALVSGVLMAPATYLLARMLYDRRVAFISIALVAVAPVLISYSTDGRGYTLISLITLLIFALGVFVRRRKNRFGWLLFAVLSALGFYTIPIFLYPYGIIMLWLCLSFLAGDRGAGYTSFWSGLRYLVVSGVITVVLTVLLYLPVIVYSGLTSLIGNSFVSPLSWGDFAQTLPVRLAETWQSWILDVPAIGVGFLIAGVVLSLVFYRLISRDRIPLQAAAVLWIVVTLLVQRPNPWARIWTYIFAPLMIWASAGIMAVSQILTGDSVRKFFGRAGLIQKSSIESWAAAVVTVLVLAFGASYGARFVREYTQPKEIEQTAIFLSGLVKENDIIAIMYPMDVPFWYYARLHGLPQKYFLDYAGRPYDHVYVMVNLGFEETAQSVLAERQKDGATCDLASLHRIQSFGYTDIYECNRN